MNFVLTYHTGTEGLSIEFVSGNTESMYKNILKHFPLEKVYSYLIILVGKKPMKFNSVCMSICRKFFPNVCVKVPRPIQALCSSCHKSQQNCDRPHL